MWQSGVSSDYGAYVTALVGGDRGALPNTVFELSLRCGDHVIDEVLVEPGREEGVSWAFDGHMAPDALLNNDERGWCVQAPTPSTRNGECVSAVVPEGLSMCTELDHPRPLRIPDAVGSVWFSEVMANPQQVADTDGEWLEIAADPGWDWNRVRVHVGERSLVIAAMELEQCLSSDLAPVLLVAANGDTRLNGGVEADVEGLPSLPNGGGELRLSVEGQLLDTWDYPESAAGVSLQRARMAHDPVTGFTAFQTCNARVPYGLGDLGTPGAPEGCVTAQIAVGAVRINEYMPNPYGVESDSVEWIELWNTSGKPLVLDGCELVDDGSDNAVLDGLTMDIDSALVLSEVAGVPVADAVAVSFVLSNTSDEIVLVCGGQEIDRVVYGSGDHRESYARQQFQSVADAVWCDAIALYDDHNRGTPGAINDACP